MGTAMPKTTANVYALAGGKVAGSETIIGTRPPGLTIEANPNNTATITGPGVIVSGYVFYNGDGSLKITGDYSTTKAQTGNCTVSYIPPTQLTSDGIIIQSSYASTYLVLYSDTETGLVASNIVEGVTINGITGTMVSGDISEYFTLEFGATGKASYTRNTMKGILNYGDPPINVADLPTNNGAIFFAVNNARSNFYATINSGSRQTISSPTEISDSITSLTIDETNWDATSIGCPVIFFN